VVVEVLASATAGGGDASMSDVYRKSWFSSLSSVTSSHSHACGWKQQQQ
jgi:hypothetical protein